jgi:2-keto-4-pentenoate hydratase/2-oxohepta-3-ene-1,7-dioic acid hydratase in catechol pathway
MKSPDTVIGPNDTVLIPRKSIKTDWEVELAVIIGSRARYLDGPANAWSVIGGYAIANDVSEREFQLERGGQWDKGKGCDTFGPLGPWLVTSDEVGDPANLSMWLDVNGTRRQNGSTRTMIFKPAFLVSYLSQFMSLQPGDVITTGTPPGVGMGIKPEPIFLNVGDVMELGIEKLGTQRQVVAAA